LLFIILLFLFTENKMWEWSSRWLGECRTSIHCVCIQCCSRSTLYNI